MQNSLISSNLLTSRFSKKQLAVLLMVSVVIGLSVLNWVKETTLAKLRAHARQQENILSIANSVATFSDPLPGNFCWRSGLSLLLSKSITVQDSDKFMIITIDRNDKVLSGFSPLDRCLELGTELGNNALARKWNPTGTGALSVGGHDLLYQTGEVTLASHKVGEFRGNIALKDKNISIDAFGQIDKPFDMVQLQSLLDSIKSFR